MSLDSRTCYTPWPVFRDVTNGSEQFPPHIQIPLNGSDPPQEIPAWSDKTANNSTMMIIPILFESAVSLTLRSDNMGVWCSSPVKWELYCTGMFRFCVDSRREIVL